MAKCMAYHGCAGYFAERPDMGQSRRPIASFKEYKALVWWLFLISFDNFSGLNEGQGLAVFSKGAHVRHMVTNFRLYGLWPLGVVPFGVNGVVLYRRIKRRTVSTRIMGMKESG